MKKLASLLLTVVLLAAMLTMFAVPASAEEESQTGDTDITWELSEDSKTLTFTGKGAMPDYDTTTFEDRPWHSAAETVTTVQINPGITALGAYAFFHFENLASVSIPESVTSIGKNAFTYCSSLAGVTIPESVQSIDIAAFSNCSSLESVTIPSSVASIGNNVFACCTSLKSVTIPYGVTGIGNSMFHGCTNLTSVTIPSGVTSIGESAFAFCSSLTNLTIPYGLKSIGASAFRNCTNLESISFPSSITNIGDMVLDRCSNLTRVTVKAKTPPTWVNLVALYSQNAKSKLYIPDGTREDYEKGDWRNLFSQKKAKEAYVVDDQPGENGTITFDKDCFPTETYTEPSETVTVTVTPAEGYLLKADSLSVVAENGEAIALTQDETDPMKYTFTMPCSNVTVKAEFEEITDESEPTLTATVFSEGNIWLIIAVAVVVIAGVAALVIVKKKKKPAVAGGTESKDE